MTDDDLSGWTPDEWAALQAELDELEAADPDVAAAAEAYRVARDRILAKPQWMFFTASSCDGWAVHLACPDPDCNWHTGHEAGVALSDLVIAAQTHIEQDHR